MNKMKNSKHIHLAILMAGLFMSSYANLAFGYEHIAEPKNMSVDMKKPTMGYISFEQYQQTIDDLFKIAFAMPRDDEEGGLNNMIINLNRKIVENPADVDSLVTLGHLYRILEQPSEANRFYQKAIALKPEELNLHCFSALMLFQVGKFEEAIKALDAAIKVDANDVHAWLARGRTLAKLGEYKGAIFDFEKAIEIMPENESAKMLLGQLYEMDGNVSAAYQTFESLSKEEVEAAAMTAFLITPQGLKQAGLLNEKYFMYFEDLDYCRELKKAGLKVYYLPRAEVIHHHGASGKKIARFEDQWRRLIPSSKIYHGLVKHYLFNFILWSGQKLDTC